MKQSEVLRNIADWTDATDLPAAAPLRHQAARAHGGGAPAYGTVIDYLFTDPAGQQALERWWNDSIRPLVPEARGPVLDEIFRFDLLTQPLCPPKQSDEVPVSVDGVPLHVVQHAGERFYVLEGVSFDYDVPGVLADIRVGRVPRLQPNPALFDIFYLDGALNAVKSTNHEEIMHFMGKVVPSGLLPLRDANTRDKGALAADDVR
jgi:radical SAM C-methyltransferase